MRNKYYTYIIAVVSILICLSSCYSTKKAYVGTKQKKASLATVKGVSKTTQNEDNTYLYSIDTILVAGYKKGLILPGTHTIEVVHGQKTVSGLFVLIWFQGNYLVTFDAEAGKTYILNAETIPETNHVDVYVTNANTGERIASTVDYKYKLKEKE